MVKQESVTHDFTKGGWGHHVEILRVDDGGQQLRVTGHGPSAEAARCAVGDYLLLPNGARSSRYQVAQIEYMYDPADQFFATLRFAPREE